MSGTCNDVVILAQSGTFNEVVIPAQAGIQCAIAMNA